MFAHFAADVGYREGRDFCDDVALVRRIEGGAEIAIGAGYWLDWIIEASERTVRIFGRLFDWRYVD